jgi:LAS superfamily LD-carboxypeptidase LdcB
VVFEQSVCFGWLSKGNYKNAKSNGWIPSYPDGAKKQGPDPESWEYVWVGKQNLIE